MKLRNLFLLLLSVIVSACNNNTAKSGNNNPPDDSSITCADLVYRDVVLEIADSIIADKDNKNIWNLDHVDTTEYLSVEDYFTNTKTKNRLVVLGGTAGMSAGNARYLLILFDCTDSLNILWAGQVGEIKADEIKDYNHDGIKDIVCRSGMTWMGECNSTIDLFNFKGDTQNVLFSAGSRSVIDCGGENLNESIKPGDTLESNNECTIMPGPGANSYFVKQITTVKIDNGGKTDEEVIARLEIFRDSMMTEIK